MTVKQHDRGERRNASSLRLPVLSSPLLDTCPGVIHGITRRRPGLGAACGNLSYSGTRDAEDAWRMRQLWSAAIGLDPDRLVTAGQVHGNGVLRVFAEQAGTGARPGSGLVGIADALISNEPGVVLASMHADCLPILLVDPDAPAIGVVHAGWRGTVANIAGAAITALTEEFGTHPGRVLAFLGPAIGPDCYEVGDEVATAWMDLVGRERQQTALQSRGTKWHFDLAGANALLLQAAGVPSGQIERSGVCTRCGGEDWFSHRGQGPQTGRFGAFIALDRPPKGTRT